MQRGFQAPTPSINPNQRTKSHFPTTDMPTVTDSKTNVETFLSNIIANYISRNEYFDIDTVVQQLFKSYKITSWSQLNMNDVEDPYNDLGPLSNLVLKHSTLYLYIDVFKYVRMIGTLSELEQEISSHFGKHSYADLHLGPILTHPKIRELFHLHDVQTIRPITSIEIIELFYQYTRNLKYGEKANWGEFKAHAAEQFGVKKWTDLGVHIASFAYLLKVIKIRFLSSDTEIPK